MRRHAARQAYEEVVLATKPVLYVPMQGSATRELIKQSAVTVSGALRAQNGPFRGSHSMLFDGSNDRVTPTNDASFHPGDTFTVGCWFNLKGAGADTGGIMYTNQANDLTMYIPAANGKLTLRKSGASEVFQTTRTFLTPFTDGWQHALIAKNAGTSVTCYIAGIAVAGTTTNATMVAGGSAPTIGEGNASTNAFNGLLAHVAVWNRVLTAAEAAELYRAGVNAV